MAQMLDLLRCRRRANDAAADGGKPARVDPDQWRFDVVRSVGEECQTDRELWGVLRRTRKFFKTDFVCYDGFEPSGRMHIAQGVFKAVNVNKCTGAGGVFIFWVADWFALMNDKMGGDLEKIKTVGQYFIEVWKATGMDMSKVQFRWSSDEINGHAVEYWGQALDIARKTTLARVKKCCQIMGRAEDKLTAAQIMYPVMQASDIFFLKADICQLGVDQRKVNMLARDYCDAIGRRKPVVLSHHMLYGLAEGQAKMSKSNPDSAIFMEDTPEDVERKIRQAFCPRSAGAARSEDAEAMQLVKDELMNPCLDYLQHILFGQPGYAFSAAGKVYTRYEDAKAAFLSGELSETELKDRLVEEVNKLLDPVRKHFSADPFAKDLLAKITQWKKDNLTAPNVLVRLEPRPAFASKVFVVFAPLPGTHVRLEDVLGTLRRLKAAPADVERVLWLEDWTASAWDCVGASDACIRGYYEILLFGLRGLAPSLMDGVRVCWQSELILSGPSEYWISVINAGRRTSLDMIRNALAPGDSLENASQVFASLMHIGDVLCFTGSSSLTLCCDERHENLHRLAGSTCESYGLKAPEVLRVDAAPLRLLAPGEGAEADVNVMLTDKEVEVNKKVKKSFCMPENTEFNPPIAWVAELVNFQEFLVARKPDNGGDKTYTDAAALTQDFASGALHPGDLKPSLSKALNALLEPLREGLAKQDVLKKAQKDLEAFVKAQSKKK
mmetsp:Transcript_115014/g.321426  ORF Transcript_115014/g.321426 Transcript_115014/m.321426 type:complete len:724 (+) Transcript_115014:84-2255(+)